MLHSGRGRAIKTGPQGGIGEHTMRDSFDLLAERWIPVLWANGKAGRVGIREAFTQAGSIRQIAASNLLPS